MKRTLCRVSLALLVIAPALLVSLTVDAQTRVRVVAPPSPDYQPPPPVARPEILSNTSECASYINQLPKRQRCFDCVNRGSRFNRQGDYGMGFCVVHSAPPPPPQHLYLRTAQDCISYIPDLQRRQHCFNCVRRNWVFQRDGYGPGHCVASAPVYTPPPPPPPQPQVEVMRTVQDCTSYVHNMGKRQRCYTCVQGGGTFYRQAQQHLPGYCSMPAPPPPPPNPGPEYMRTISDCNYIHFGPKRQSCYNCVNGRGTFVKQGHGHPGYCNAAPPPPPPPPSGVYLMTVPQCFSSIAHPGLRNHCRKCVMRGGRWNLNAAICQ